jgi:hypothetical protein
MTRNTTCLTTFAFIAAIIAVGFQSRPPTPQPPTTTAAVQPADIGDTEPAPTPLPKPSFVADRRPIGAIWTGPAPEHDWTPDAIRKIGITMVTTRPWKRYMIHMPAGTTDHLFSGAQYWPISHERRLAYRDMVRAANGKRRHVYIYGGIFMGSAYTDSEKNPPLNDFFANADHQAMWEEVIKPWKSWGADGWVFDAGSWAPAMPSALAWCKWLREEQELWAAIEAFPLFGCPDCKIDQKVALEVPSMAVYGYNPSFPNWRAPEGSEMHVLLVSKWTPEAGYGPTVTPDQVADLLRRNFIPAPDLLHDHICVEGYKRAGMQIPR